MGNHTSLLILVLTLIKLHTLHSHDLEYKSFDSLDIEATFIDEHEALPLNWRDSDHPDTSPIASYISSPNAYRNHKVKACIFILARNSDLQSLKHTLRKFEQTFNHRFGYPYVIVNDKKFTSHFKRDIRLLTNSLVEFGQVPVEHWSYPEWIDRDRVRDTRERMYKDGIIYGESESYRFMCRYYSGFFFRHELVLKYDYYWRIEPGVDFNCILDYDPFIFMQRNSLEYGFTISLFEIEGTIKSLWNTTKEFMSSKKINSKMDYVQTGTEYNNCHFWSNFEIASFNFFRSEKYISYFDFLDQKGGFFYERWGDAPVHTLALAMFAPSSKIHHFSDIGYFHSPLSNCPRKENCLCDPTQSFDYRGSYCVDRLKDSQWLEKHG